MTWPTLRLSEAAELSLGKMLDQKKNKGVLLPYLANLNVRWGSFELSDLREMRFEPHEHDRYGLRQGDIVMCEGGEPGRCAIWREQVSGIMLQKALHRIRAKDRLDPSFLFYCLLHSGRSGELEHLFTGATIKHLPSEQLAKVMVPVPPLFTQRRIASVLGAYDDLIEVNRRRIALLERTARLLFEEWFVQFRFPDHERSAMKDGRPEGWQQLTLGELAEVRLGKMLDAAKNRGELRPYLANVNVRWGSFDLSDLRSMRFEPDEAAKYGLTYGDIIMCEGGEPGRCAMWKGEAQQMMLQKALHRIRSKPSVDRHYLFHHLFFMARSQRISGLFTGSTIKHLPREKLLSLRIEVPPNHLSERFGRLVTPIEAQIGTLQAANRHLHEMQEMLLPQLISGELPVATAERELEAAA